MGRCITGLFGDLAVPAPSPPSREHTPATNAAYSGVGKVLKSRDCEVIRERPSWELFLCRRCCGLAYDCQREKWDDRARRRCRKIRLRLGGTWDFVSPFPWKPKGMHWRTYFRLREKAQAAELQSLRDIGLWVDRMEANVMSLSGRRTAG